MESMMTRFRSWYQYVIQTYRSRFDEMLMVVDHIAFQNMDERLEFYLKRYAEQIGKRTLELSHQQIADDLNSSREVISRLLKKMELQGRVKLHRNLVEANKLLSTTTDLTDQKQLAERLQPIEALIQMRIREVQGATDEVAGRLVWRVAMLVAGVLAALFAFHVWKRRQAS